MMDSSLRNLTASVIVPTYNRCERLRLLLDSLEQQFNAGSRFEVIVAIDGATDDTSAMLAKLTTSYPLRVLTQKNSGPAAARNLAVAAATGDVLVFLDDDVVPSAGLIERYLELHRRDPYAVATGPMVAPPDKRLATWLLWEAITLQKQYDAMIAGRWAPTPRQFYTANASVRREHVLAAGGFDQEFTRAEDIELAYRMAEHGARFYFLPEAVVYHEPDRSLAGWLRVPYEYGRYDVVMARERGRTHVLMQAYREWSDRQLFNRLMTRWCVGRRWQSIVVKTLSQMVAATGPARLDKVKLKLCSFLFNVQYWQGVADATGLGSRVWDGWQAGYFPQHRGRSDDRAASEVSL